jgi:hypothetical protein
VKEEFFFYIGLIGEFHGGMDQVLLLEWKLLFWSLRASKGFLDEY